MSAQPAEVEEFQTSQSETEQALKRVVGRIGDQISALSVNVANMSGMVGDVNADVIDQLSTLDEVVKSVDQMSRQNSVIVDLASETNEIATQVRDGIETTVGSIEGTVSKSVEDIQAMASSSEQAATEFEAVRAKLDDVYGFSQSITKISSETQFLAINAGVLAANTGGEAGKGFAVIAQSVRELANETSDVSKQINQQLEELKASVDRLHKNTQANSQTAIEASERTGEIDAQIKQFKDFSAEVSTMARNIVDISEPIRQNSEICTQVAAQVSDFNQASHANSDALTQTSQKFDQLVAFSEEMILLVEQSGVETKDSPIIQLCSQAAKDVEVIFENAIARGRISLNDLFDTNYAEIEGSDPVQHMTRFVPLTDEMLPPIQEAMVEAHERIVFCAAVDRNGFLPTHNLIYSQPQSDDPVWNAANCRNRRIFNDRTGAAAGANTKPFIMQTYRRDMGGGNFVMMKDLSVPIYVQGRHWGGLRMGVKV